MMTGALHDLVAIRWSVWFPRISFEFSCADKHSVSARTSSAGEMVHHGQGLDRRFSTFAVSPKRVTTASTSF
jgi:hypothetical protein